MLRVDYPSELWFCGVFLIKYQYETKFYLLALIFFVIMCIPGGFANDLSINVTKSS